jgi:hypothetical protein
MKNINHDIMNKKIAHIVLFCAAIIALAGCDDWVQDRTGTPDYGMSVGTQSEEGGQIDATIEETQLVSVSEGQTMQAIQSTQAIGTATQASGSGTIDATVTVAATGCTTGAESCTCYGNNTCNTGLTCASEICVDMRTVKGADGLAPKRILAFDLPAGWSRDEGNLQNRAIWYHQTADGVKPYVLIEAFGSKKGPNEDVRKSAQDDHAERMKNCQDPLCEFMPGYEEKNIGGVELYISTDADEYWGAWSYSSIIWFEKRDETYTLILHDLVKNQEDAIKTVVQTIHLTNE